MTAKRLGRWSIGLPVGTLVLFLSFWWTGDANGWFGRRGSDLAAATFALLLLAMALSVVAALVLSIMAWSAAMREGVRAWPQLIPGLAAGFVVSLFVILVLWAFFASMGSFR